MSTIKVTNLRHENATSDNISLDSNGQVGLGTATPSNYYLSELVTFGADGHGITIASSTTSASGRLYFADGTSGDARYRGAISYDHSADAMSFDTAAGERMRLLSGGGLTFNGDTAAANALDDYEEGTWTPQVLSGVTSPSYATQYGGYVKIGSLVYASWDIDLNGGTANTSHIQFGNFPFASESAAQQTFAAGVISYGTMFDQSTLHNLQLHMSWNGSTVVEVYNYGSTVRGNDSGVNILNRLIATIVYRTSA